jgi:hypothetical protein
MTTLLVLAVLLCSAPTDSRGPARAVGYEHDDELVDEEVDNGTIRKTACAD